MSRGHAPIENEIAIFGATKSVVNKIAPPGPQQHGGAGSSSSSSTVEDVDSVPLAIPRRECAEGKRDSVSANVHT